MSNTEQEPLNVGDRVRVTDGFAPGFDSLKGIEGTVEIVRSPKTDRMFQYEVTMATGFKLVPFKREELTLIKPEGGQD